VAGPVDGGLDVNAEQAGQDHDAVGNLAQNARRQVLCEHVAVQGKNERFHQTLFRWLDKQPIAATLPGTRSDERRGRDRRAWSGSSL
jgi:hypothetical protein